MRLTVVDDSIFFEWPSFYIDKRLTVRNQSTDQEHFCNVFYICSYDWFSFLFVCLFSRYKNVSRFVQTNFINSNLYWKLYGSQKEDGRRQRLWHWILMTHLNQIGYVTQIPTVSHFWNILKDKKKHTKYVNQPKSQTYQCLCLKISSKILSVYQAIFCEFSKLYDF